MENTEKPNEIQLVTRYIEGSGYRVKDVRYFEDYIAYIAAGDYYIGVNRGQIAQHQFFYGNISIWDQMTGVVVLANRNEHRFVFATLLYGGVEIEACRQSLCVGSGLDLLGSGEYLGNRRLYGVGCNFVRISTHFVGASAISGGVLLNGLIWTII